MVMMLSPMIIWSISSLLLPRELLGNSSSFMVPLLSAARSSAHFSTALPMGSSVVFSNPIWMVTTSPAGAGVSCALSLVSSAAFSVWAA